MTIYDLLDIILNDGFYQTIDFKTNKRSSFSGNNKKVIPINKKMKEEVEMKIVTNKELEELKKSSFLDGRFVGMEQQYKNIVEDLSKNFEKAKTPEEFCTWLYESYLRNK